MTVREATEIPVRGGLLGVEITGPDPSTARAVVVLVHGISANYVTWRLVTSRLPPDVATVAVDLRGRGTSGGLPGPWGMRTHADDLVAVLDHLGVRQAVLVGHSMGAWVTTTFAERHPERVAAAVLVDGGVSLGLPEGLDPQDALDALLGPATARLSMTFASRRDYHLYWQAHPAFEGIWNETMEAYFDHDLAGVEPELRSRALEEAVRFDGAETVVDDEVSSAIDRISCPTEMVRVDLGVMNQPHPIVPLAAIEAIASANGHITITTVPRLNHYTITLTASGADAVAAAIVRAL